MPRRRGSHIFYLVVIVTSWAANWPLMKLALGEVRPLVFVLFRLVGSLLLIAPVLLWRRGSLVPVWGERLGLMWVGQLQVAVFLIRSIIGLAIVPPGRAIVLAYAMPLWAIPIGLWLWPEPLGRFQLAGAAVGFAGLVLLMNSTPVDWGNRRTLAGDALLLLAAIAWALGFCPYRRRSWRSSFWVQTFWQLAVSTIVVAAIALPEAPARRSAGRPDWSRSSPPLRCDHSPWLFFVEQGPDDDAGGGRRPGPGVDPNRRLCPVDGDFRRRDHRRHSDQRCPDCRRNCPALAIPRSGMVAALLWEGAVWMPAMSRSHSRDVRFLQPRYRRLCDLEALPRFHLPDPVLQFRVFGKRPLAVRDPGEVVEQRDRHQIGEGHKIGG
jgi:drug/metabolite transporter (DMT)-like permease